MQAYLGYYLLAINIISVFVVIWDKHCARKKKWRVPEKTLFGLCFLGGSVAVYATMRLIHHKTLHKRFMFGIPLILFAQLILVALIYRYFIF